MSKPILRAGPYASPSGSFLDEPSVASSDVLPVNCAKDTNSANWPWLCYVKVSAGSDFNVEGYSSGFQSKSISRSEIIPAGDFLSAYIEFGFYVQCSSDITFTMNYDLSATAPAFPFTEAGVSVSAGGGSGNVGDSDSFIDSGVGLGGTASVSGSKTFTVPASIKPQGVVFIASAYTGGSLQSGFGSVSLSLSF